MEGGHRASTNLTLVRLYRVIVFISTSPSVHFCDYISHVPFPGRPGGGEEGEGEAHTEGAEGHAGEHPGRHQEQVEAGHHHDG